MRANVSAEVTASLSGDDLITLAEDGELSVDGVTLTVADKDASKLLSEYGNNE
jgi:riboflavin synthase alpha subunit